MLLSKAFIPTGHNIKTEGMSQSQFLMLKSGMIMQLASGVYSWLPLGWRVLHKISNIIREEMDGIGFQEMLIPVMQPASIWHKTGRYRAENKEILRVRDRHQTEFIYGPTAEDWVTEIFRQAQLSYHQLPQNLYNIQWKFRDERRPRSGVLRCKEFLMKDGYSFDIDEENAAKTYHKVFDMYIRVFHKIGLKVIPALADNGNMGGKVSHDFHVLSDVGEDVITFHKAWLDLDKPQWLDLEKYFATSKESECPKDCLQRKSIEVGHIFMLGTRYTEVLNVNLQDRQTSKFHPYMGCYGIGVSRVVGTIIEKHSDENGIIWPMSIAPYKFMLLNLSPQNDDCVKYCDEIYAKLGDDVLYDDRRKVTPGEKFATADLLGMPVQIIVGNHEYNDRIVVVKCRATGKKTALSLESFLSDFVLKC